LITAVYNFDLLMLMSAVLQYSWVQSKKIQIYSIVIGYRFYFKIFDQLLVTS